MTENRNVAPESMLRRAASFFGIWVLLPLIGLFGVYALIGFLYEFNHIEMAKRYRLWVIGFILVWVPAWITQGYNEGIWRFIKYLRRPPLLKWFIVTCSFGLALAYCEVKLNVNLEKFVAQDKTSLSAIIVLVAFGVLIENACQAFLLAYRIWTFRRLHDEACTAGRERLVEFVRMARDTSSVIGRYIYKVGLTSAPRKRPSQSVLKDTLREELFSCASMARMMVVLLPSLGLLGTIIGIKIGMDGMGAASEGGAESFAKGVSVFLQGMNTALNTTLISCFLGGLYFYLSAQILRSGATKLYCEVLDFVQIYVVAKKDVELLQRNGGES